MYLREFYPLHHASNDVLLELILRQQLQHAIPNNYTLNTVLNTFTT